MIDKVIMVAYLVVVIISWLLISGWVFAEDRTKWYKCPEQARSDSAFAAGWAILPSVFWPLGLLMSFLATGYAEHGWRPVWKIKEDTWKE